MLDFLVTWGSAIISQLRRENSSTTSAAKTLTLVLFGTQFKLSGILGSQN